MTITTKISATSPHFERAAADAMGVLASAMAELQRMQDDAEKVADECELMYLGSLALLAHHRGRHIVEGIPELCEMDEDAANYLPGLLTAHEHLIEHTSGLDPFLVLEFVNDVGNLCRGAKRYVERH